jgi:pyruvate dehydrogenase E1 component beta subunit
MVGAAQPDQSEGEHEVTLPRLSRALDHATVVRWFVSDGQAVVEGDVLAEIAAGHVTMEVEASVGGVVSSLLQPAGPAALPVGTVIARISAPSAGDSGAGVAQGDGTGAEPQGTAFRVCHVESPARGPASEMTYADALRRGLAAEMRADADVFVIGESVADFGRCSPVVAGLAEEFGARRVVGTPITPSGFMGLAVGAAMAGLKPVVEVTAWALSLQGLDAIVSSAAKTRYRSGGQVGVPLVLRGRHGRWAGTGATHSLDLAAWLANVPGLKVVCPATPACAKGLIAAAIRDPDPVIVLEPDSLYETTGAVPDNDGWQVALGTARLARQGRDLSIVTYGAAVVTALQAAEQLAEGGVEAEVVDLRSLRPLDLATVLASVRKTGRLLTLDEAWPVCSIAAEICAAVAVSAFGALRAAPVRLAAADVPAPYAESLAALVVPDADEVAARARRLVGRDVL